MLVNPYVRGTSLSRDRPLPSRPENDVGHVYRNGGYEVDEQRDVSVVLENPDVQETRSRSMPRSRSDVGQLPETREQGEPELKHHHHHSVVDGKFFLYSQLPLLRTLSGLRFGDRISESP